MDTDGLQHISELIRQKYPLAPNDSSCPAPTHERRWHIRKLCNETTGIILATIIVLIATPATIYFLANLQLRAALATLTIALTAAFSPKLFAFANATAKPQLANNNDDSRMPK